MIMEINSPHSTCCNAETYSAPAFYNTTMKTNDGKEIPYVIVCLKCGHKCTTKLI